MTRKELSEVYRLNKELKMWKDRLDDLRNKSLISGQQISDMPRSATNGISDKTFDYISQIMELQADIDCFQENIERKIYKIERYIMTLDDSLLRQIIEYRCCQLKSWEETALMIGYSTTADSCKKYFYRKFPKD